MAIEPTLGVGFVKVRGFLTSGSLTITYCLKFGIGFERFLVIEVFGFIEIPLVQFFKAPTFLVASTLPTIPTFFATAYVISLVVIFDKVVF